MRIVGVDTLVFGVDDVRAAVEFCRDAGLNPVDVDETGGLFEALDGTGLEIRSKDDADLPPVLRTGNTLRCTVYGVQDAQALDEVAAELGKDRPVHRGADGSVLAADDLGFVLRFQVTKRRALNLPPEKVNAPGAPIQRPVNVIGSDENMPALPRSLSHAVYFVPDIVGAEKFYVERLGFRLTDRLIGAGPFLAPACCDDHHTLFFIQAPDYMQGLEHFAFHLQGPTEVMLAGTRLVNKGYQSFWGPGRHKFASNWFWYFNSPMGAKFEYDADMDKHDETWVPREAHFGAEAAQLFLFQKVDKWVPGGKPA